MKSTRKKFLRKTLHNQQLDATRSNTHQPSTNRVNYCPKFMVTFYKCHAWNLKFLKNFFFHVPEVFLEEHSFNPCYLTMALRGKKSFKIIETRCIVLYFIIIIRSSTYVVWILTHNITIIRFFQSQFYLCFPFNNDDCTKSWTIPFVLNLQTF